MQLMRFAPGLEQEERIQRLKAEVEALTLKNQGYRGARKLAKIRTDQEYEEFLAGFAANRLPLGYEVKTSKPVALPLKQFNQLSLYFSEKASAALIFKNLITYAKKENMVVAFLKAAKESCLEELKLPRMQGFLNRRRKASGSWRLFSVPTPSTATISTLNTARRNSGTRRRPLQSRRLSPI